MQLITKVDNIKKYQEISGTLYHKETDDYIISMLENARINDYRVRITYGDVNTGEAWGNRPETGKIGRSTGSVKIPLLIKTKRSLGGGGILDHCIIKLEYKEYGKYRTMYNKCK